MSSCGWCPAPLPVWSGSPLSSICWITTKRNSNCRKELFLIMKLGLHIYDFTWPGGANQLGPTLVKVAQAAEVAGFDRISTMDHVWQSHYLGGPEREVLSCYPTLTYLAAHTSRIKLLALATASPYWQPILLAKTVTTLDVLSGGRAWLGIGAGDYEEEASGSGLPFPPLKERYERLEEMLQICLRMWQGQQGDERPFEESTTTSSVRSTCRRASRDHIRRF